ncbi:hypothetical protein [Candidatus Ichthyocystis hellenicum]|uniref:hypothetical protein n=1 Tax=Candidatus Ichthyocystis hellenicum TaxID=1561003 RepID=UPI000B8224CF|nr:hypothetical protein [Candidatus Ichthyocystis hellenicum]
MQIGSCDNRLKSTIKNNNKDIDLWNQLIINCTILITPPQLTEEPSTSMEQSSSTPTPPLLPTPYRASIPHTKEELPSYEEAYRMKELRQMRKMNQEEGQSTSHEPPKKKAKLVRKASKAPDLSTIPEEAQDTSD